MTQLVFGIAVLVIFFLVFWITIHAPIVTFVVAFLVIAKAIGRYTFKYQLPKKDRRSK